MIEFFIIHFLTEKIKNLHPMNLKPILCSCKDLKGIMNRVDDVDILVITINSLSAIQFYEEGNC